MRWLGSRGVALDWTIEMMPIQKRRRVPRCVACKLFVMIDSRGEETCEGTSLLMVKLSIPRYLEWSMPTSAHTWEGSHSTRQCLSTHIRTCQAPLSLHPAKAGPPNLEWAPPIRLRFTPNPSWAPSAGYGSYVMTKTCIFIEDNAKRERIPILVQEHETEDTTYSKKRNDDNELLRLTNWA